MEWRFLQPPYIPKSSSSRNKIVLLYVLSAALAVGICFLALLASSVKVPPEHVLQIVWSHAAGRGPWEGVAKSVDLMIWDIRLPRVALAFLIGSALALSGAAFQGLLRNPLADPYTIGVSSGSALGAVAAMFFGIAVFGAFTLPVFGMLGGLTALAAVFALTRLTGRGVTTETVILAGIIVSSFLGSFISLILALSGDDLKQIMFWLMGSVGMRGWSYVQLLLPFFAAGSLIVLLNRRELNALAMGEQSAHHLGVDVRRRRALIVVGASLLTGGAVSVSGTIGFVGLVVPHFVRLIIGPNHRHLLPLSMLWGGAFLVLADLIARTMLSPQELPIGVVTSLAGAPVFALLLMRERLARRWQA